MSYGDYRISCMTLSVVSDVFLYVCIYCAAAAAAEYASATIDR